MKIHLSPKFTVKCQELLLERVTPEYFFADKKGKPVANLTIGFRTKWELNLGNAEVPPIDISAPLPLDTGFFDAVVCTEGLEHLLAPQELVAEFLRFAPWSKQFPSTASLAILNQSFPKEALI